MLRGARLPAGDCRPFARLTGISPALTTLWHLGSGLPWSWCSSASTGEWAHLVEMLPQLLAASLIVADAGFVGYDFWQALRDAEHDFVIRVGANVTLLKRLGFYREGDRRVYPWPDRSAQRRQPPLTLRLTAAHDGKRPVYLVTSVLSASDLSDRWLLDLYRARWAVEVFDRSFKRCFGRHKLRSASPENAQLELDWSLAALWAACLYAKFQQCHRAFHNRPRADPNERRRRPPRKLSRHDLPGGQVAGGRASRIPRRVTC